MKLVLYPNLSDILQLHELVVDATGGSPGVRERALLEAAVERPRQTYGGEDLYTSIWSKAAALFESLIKNHPFVDGNKRTAAVAAIEFIERNGFRFVATNQQLESFALAAAEKSPGIDAIAEWFKTHSEPV